MPLIILNGGFTTSCVNDVCCPLNLGFRNGSGPGTLYTAVDITISSLCLPTDRMVSFIMDCFAVVANQLVLFADGVQIYDSGCVTGTVTDTATVPAGTAALRVILYGGCNNAGGGPSADLWSLTFSCA